MSDIRRSVKVEINIFTTAKENVLWLAGKTLKRLFCSYKTLRKYTSLGTDEDVPVSVGLFSCLYTIQ